MRKIIFFVISIVSIALSIKYKFSFFDSAITMAVIVLAWSFCRDIKSIGGNVFSLFLVFYIFCAVHVVALLELSSHGFYKDFISQSEYNNLAIWGNRLLFIVLFVFFICRRLIGSSNRPADYKVVSSLKPDNSDYKMKVFLVFIYILQIITLSLGINDSLGDAQVILPFHLNGIIDELRVSVCQFVFCVYIYHKYTTGHSINRTVVLMYIVYALIHMFVNNSKGAFVFAFFQVAILIIMMNKIKKQTVLKVFLPLLLFFLITYPIVESARQEGQMTLRSFTEAARSGSNIDEENQSSPFIRIFLSGVYYTKLVGVVDDNQAQFDFKRVPALVLMGGGAGYMTRMIDEVPETAHHSSGVTGLCDALLWGGYPLCYIVLALLSLFAFWGDKAIVFKSNPLYRVIFFMWFYNCIVATTVSYFIDSRFFASIGSIIIKLLIVRFYFAKSYTRKSIKTAALN